MEFKQLSCLILICLILVEIDASQSGEEYWKSVWPNTPLPKTLLDMFMLESETNVVVRDQEEKQDWTAFFEHDLYPGKKINLGDRKPLQSKVSNPFVARTKDEKASHQPLKIWIRNETHCEPSLKLMMDFEISKLGTNNIKTISSSFAQNQDQYVVEEVKKIGNKAVLCHKLNLKEVVYCHEVDATTTYIVPLMAPDGTKAKALTICHHDTRGMDPKVLYEVLKVKPGTIPICHFVSNKAVAWVPNDVVNDQYDHPWVI